MTTATRSGTIPVEKAIAHVREHGHCGVIDVRTLLEVAGECVPNTTCIPLDQLGRRLEDVRALDGPRLLLCRTGKRAEKARELLEAAGIVDVHVIEGGILAWSAAGGATECRRKVISLERQVRIAAGLLVVIGVVLGWLVHPGFAAIAAFVGAGVAFAGITDWCGMGLLLAKMPWNRVAQ